MGVLAEFFPQRAGLSGSYLTTSGYTTFTESVPSFSTWDGSLYDHPLTRAAIERFAVACSKLKPEFVGSKTCKPNVRKLIETWPNELMTWPAFLARCATIFEMDTTALAILPDSNAPSTTTSVKWASRFTSLRDVLGLDLRILRSLVKAFTHIGIKDWNSIFWTNEEGGGGDINKGILVFSIGLLAQMDHFHCSLVRMRPFIVCWSN